MQRIKELSRICTVMGILMLVIAATISAINAFDQAVRSAPVWFQYFLQFLSLLALVIALLRQTDKIIESIKNDRGNDAPFN